MIKKDFFAQAHLITIFKVHGTTEGPVHGRWLLSIANALKQGELDENKAITISV